MKTKKHICIVSTVPVALRVFMREHIRELSEFYKITLVVNAAESEMRGVFADDVRFIPLVIERKISIVNDIRSLWSLYRLFRREQFDCVFSIMPKSGLLAMLASFMAGVPSRFHIFTGQVWYTSTGLGRFVLKSMDKLLAFSATHVLADSPSQRTFLITEGVLRPNKISVLGKGSISGVDITRFKPDLIARRKFRADLTVDDAAIMFLYMARVTRDKGVLDLARAFSQCASEMPNAVLVIIGPDEDGIEGEIDGVLAQCRSQVRRVIYTYEPEGYMAAADVFCIPSYREGFSSATIQAAGSGCPAIASRIYGLSDAVEENETGVFHAPGDINGIKEALNAMYSDDAFRHKLSRRASARAHEEFSQSVIVAEMISFIRGRVK